MAKPVSVVGHVPLHSWLLMNPEERKTFNMSIQFGADLKIEQLHGSILKRAAKERRIVYGKMGHEAAKRELWLTFQGPWEGEPEDAPATAFLASAFSGVCISEPGYSSTAAQVSEVVITARLVGALCPRPDGDLHNQKGRTRLFLKDLRGANTKLEREYIATNAIILNIGEAIQYFEKRYKKDRVLRFAGKEIAECNLVGQ